MVHLAPIESDLCLRPVLFWRRLDNPTYTTAWNPIVVVTFKNGICLFRFYGPLGSHRIRSVFATRTLLTSAWHPHPHVLDDNPVTLWPSSLFGVDGPPIQTYSLVRQAFTPTGPVSRSAPHQHTSCRDVTITNCNNNNNDIASPFTLDQVDDLDDVGVRPFFLTSSTTNQHHRLAASHRRCTIWHSSAAGTTVNRASLPMASTCAFLVWICRYSLPLAPSSGGTTFDKCPSESLMNAHRVFLKPFGRWDNSSTGLTTALMVSWQ